MALYAFALDARKEDQGIFMVRHGPEPEEVCAALLADPPHTFPVVCIHRWHTGLFFIQLAARPKWHELQEKRG